MSSIQNFFTSRDNNTDGNTYVGQLDRLWYNPTTNSIFVSDGTTPGGNPVDLATGANAVFDGITANSISVNGNISFTGNISPAASNKIGGIAPGPGVVIGTNGILTIDSANLPVSFGNFYANNNILSIVNVDENMILQTEGTAEIQLIGNVGFYKPDGIPPNISNRFAQFNNDGQVTFLVPGSDIDSAFKIIGSTTGNYIVPGIEGAMIHITGQLDVPSRCYYDGNGDYVAWVARRWNGNVAVPTQVLANEDVLRINATAATDAGVGNVAMAQIQFQALENQTTTAQGSTVNFIVTPVGSSAASRVEVANVTVANGVTATKFTTSGTVSATGNISGGNLILSTGGLISSSGLISTTGNIAAGNIQTTGNIIATNTFVGNVAGLITQRVRNAGTIADAGTLTIDFSSDDLVYCTWNNGMTITGTNYTAGRIVTVMALKGTGSGTDSITFNGVTASHVSSGTTTESYSADVTAIIEFISTTALVGGLYIKL